MLMRSFVDEEKCELKPPRIFIPRCVHRVL